MPGPASTLAPGACDAHDQSSERNDRDTLDHASDGCCRSRGSAERLGLFAGRAADAVPDEGRPGDAGHRLPDTSKVVGSTVYNEANETVGTIDDLIVTPNERVPFAVLSVGGFLGMGTKYVVVPFSSLVVKDKKMVVPGATKDSLKSLPEFKYSP
jgi:sporulation protein YlmC with PRC-barrel domain